MDKFDALDNFDNLLKNNAHNDICVVPDILDKKIDNVLKNLPDKKRHKPTSIKIALIAAMIALISVTSVLAGNIPAVKNMVNTAISYFNNIKGTRYFTDKNSFEKFNKSVGVSSENQGIKLTVDNIAVDDNFINVFYTIESNEPMDMKFTDESKLFEAFLSTPFLDFKINGKEIGTGNHNDTDAYFESDKILKVMRRINVSQITLPQNFDLEISTDEIFRTKGTWGIATTIDKSDVAPTTKTVKPNVKAAIDFGDFKHNITIDKISISPFGSQIVISEKVKKDRIFDTFALLDDKGNVLDVLNTDMQSSGFGKSTNSFEFVKATVDIKSITLVPIKFTESGKAVVEKQSIQKLPITFKTCNTGSRVVDKIDFDKNIIKISYHNEGVELWDPCFQFFDALGNEITFGDGGCGLTSSVDRQNGEYTQILTFANENIDFSKIVQIGTFSGVQHLELLKEQQIKINLD